jgi:hypothetical protein
LIDQAIEVLFQLARDFGRSPGARAIQQALGPLLRKALHPYFLSAELAKWKVAETVLTWWPATTSRTACARRKTRASWVCFRTVSQVGSACSGKWLLRGRMALLLGNEGHSSHT